MDRGLVISGLGHLALILWVFLGDWFFLPSDAPVIQTANVSVISSAEFDAMQSEAPAAPLKAPEQPTPPKPADAKPVTPEAKPAPDKTPDAPKDVPISDTPQPDAAPDATAPLAAQDQPIPVPNSDQAPAPRPIDRVAAVPVDPTHKAPDVADTATPQQTDQPTPDVTPVVKQPDAAPQAAAPQVVTEATNTSPDAPQLAPTSSKRPQTRPKAPSTDPTADAAVQAAVADAVAAAVADSTAPTDKTSDTGGVGDALKGPPMTQGEKDALRVAVSKCWNLGAVSTEAMNTVITVRVALAEDGKPDLTSIRMSDFTGGSQAAANTMLEAARSAIFRCGRDGFPLPLDKYDQWKDLELVFDPRGMSLR